MTRTAVTLREDLHTFIVICRWILPTRRQVSHKSYRATHIFLCQQNFFNENPAFYETMWQNIIF